MRRRSPDLYQLLAYCTATHLSDGLLVYASGEAEPLSHVVRFSDKRLHVRILGLDGEPEAILDEVRHLSLFINSLYTSESGSQAA